MAPQTSAPCACCAFGRHQRTGARKGGTLGLAQVWRRPMLEPRRVALEVKPTPLSENFLVQSEGEADDVRLEFDGDTEEALNRLLILEEQQEGIRRYRSSVDSETRAAFAEEQKDRLRRELCSSVGVDPDAGGSESKDSNTTKRSGCQDCNFRCLLLVLVVVILVFVAVWHCLRGSTTSLVMERDSIGPQELAASRPYAGSTYSSGFRPGVRMVHNLGRLSS